MADDFIGKENNWFSAELRILEAEYEKSKLQVYQDTLFCKRSMAELELLCKNEQLRKNVRVNDKLKEHDCRLQEQLESLSTELKNTTSQLQTAQNTLQNEKTKHNLEKKELEDKMKSEIEKEMEDYRATASKKENLLQEEIKIWQEKHIEAFKNAEDLRAELKKKNVSMRTKGIQAKAEVNNASTMAEADPQKCDVSTQVQTSPLASDRSRENDDHARQIGEDLREGNRTGKGKKGEVEATEKENKKGLTKETKSKRDQPKGDKASAKGRTAKDKTVQKSKKIDENKEKEDEKIDKNGNNREKNSRKRKASQEQKCTSESETTTTLADEQSPLSITQAEKRGEVLDPTNASDFLMPSSASQEDDVPFQYSKTPGRLQKSPQSGQNLEKGEDQSDISTQDEITSSKEENNSLKKEGKAALKDVPQLAVVEDTENKQGPEKDEEVRVEFQNDDLRDHENSFAKKQIRETENIATREQNCLSIEEDKECGPILSEAQDGSERKNACKDKRGEEVLGVQDENKKKRKNKKESKTKISSAEEKVSPEKGKLIEEKRADENSDNQESRVLRRRAKETRQKPNDIDGETVAKKCKTSVKYRKGREPAILDKSSPEAEQFPRDTEMSSREIDRPGVDRARLSRAATSRASTDGTSQLPETEVLGGLTDGVATHGEIIRDYKSDQGGSVLSDNRIRTVEETNTGGCVHKAVDEGKSSCSEKCQLGRELKENEKDKLPSKNRNTKRTEQELEAVSDVSESKKQQDSDSTEVDYNTQLTRQTAKHTSRDTGRSKRNGQNPAEKTVTRSKEKAPNGKQTGKKKRKPTSSVREVLAPADQQSNSDCATSTEIPSMLDCTKKRKTLFNSRENSLMVSMADVQISFVNRTLSKSRANAGIPPSLSAFMRSFIAPKLKKSQ